MGNRFFITREAMVQPVGAGNLPRRSQIPVFTDTVISYDLDFGEIRENPRMIAEIDILPATFLYSRGRPKWSKYFSVLPIPTAPSSTTVAFGNVPKDFLILSAWVNVVTPSTAIGTSASIVPGLGSAAFDIRTPGYTKLAVARNLANQTHMALVLTSVTNPFISSTTHIKVHLVGQPIHEANYAWQ